jgi:diguanylate cyclase (GGDEF)-like protein/PAS domain S-box-containing protein
MVYLILVPIFVNVVVPFDRLGTDHGFRSGLWVHASVAGSPAATTIAALVNFAIAAGLYRARKRTTHPNVRGRFTGVLAASIILGAADLVFGVWMNGRYPSVLPPYPAFLGWIVWLVVVRVTVARYALVPSHSERYRSWFDQYPAALVITDPAGRVIDMNAAGQEMVGSPVVLPAIFPRETAKQDWDRFSGALKTGAKVTSWEQAIIDAAHSPRLVSVDGEVLEVGTGRYWAFGLRDITRQRELQQRTERLAHTDPLTGIGNSLGFRRQLAEVTQARPMEPAAIVFMDLDNFKKVNDTYGHRVGDRILVEVARRLTPLFRPQDMVARLGGDEFVVLLKNTRDFPVEDVLDRIMRQFVTPISVADTPDIAMTASMGLSRFPLDSLDPDTLLHQADQAMYEAKRAGKNQFRIYQSEAVEQV